MKVYVQATALLLLLVRPAAATASPGRIASVVVYSDRAQVTRSRALACPTRSVRFDGLPSNLIPRSLQAAVLGGSADVVGVTWSEAATGPRTKARALLRKIKAADLAARQAEVELGDKRAVVARLERFRGQLERTWARQVAANKPRPARWDAALDLIRTEAVAAAAGQVAARARLVQTKRRRGQLKARLSQIRTGRRRTTLRAVVHLRCRAPGALNLELSYLVRNATWRVAYQARADTRRRQAVLVAQAVVRQETGEDWRGVKLSVSTLDVGRDNLPPRITPLGVSSSKPAQTRKVLERRHQPRKHLSGRKPAPSSAVASGGEQPDAVRAVLRLQAQGRHSVPGDGRRIVVKLARARVQAQLAHETVPRLFPFVYLRARVQNPFPFVMLPGPLALYRDGEFLGRTRIEQRAPGEQLSLSFGAHNQLQVRRYVKQEKLVPGGTFGNRKRLVHRYAIQVANWTRRTQRVLLLESIPVSAAAEIKVQLDADSTRPSSHNRAEGILGWELQLAPRSKRTIRLAYTVEVPSDYQVSGY
jgi:uncharacterized protein (TIGR02231 family)